MSIKNNYKKQNGFYPGTFDPIHLGHLKIARNASKFVEKVWLLPNPKNSKSKPQTTDLDIRRRLIEIAISKNHKVFMPNGKAWDVYVKTYRAYGVDEAIAAISQYLRVDPVHIVGQDVYEKRPHTAHKVMIIQRGDRTLIENKETSSQILKSVGSISSSAIRKKLAKGLFIEELPAKVFKEIKKRGLYNSAVHETRVVKKWILDKINGWKKKFDRHEIHVELGGSLISGLFVREGAEKYDADVKFIVKNPQDPAILKKIGRVTGLKYKKTIRIKELPSEKNISTLMEEIFKISGVLLPIDVEGCVRQGPYFNSHKFYTKFFSQHELEEIRKKKKELRIDKNLYKKYKYKMRMLLLKRMNTKKLKQVE
jgi:cytidyltransferase-like protein